MSALWGNIKDLEDRYPIDTGIFKESPYLYFSRNNPEKKISGFYADRFPGLVGKNWSMSFLQGYRADPTNKHGSKTGLETRPTILNMRTMEKFLQAYKEARQQHPDIVPEISPQQFANMALNEGRDDFGYNSTAPTVENKKSMKVFNDISAQGYGWEASGFISALIEKSQKAKELNKPFDEVWNGTGTSKDTNRTGAQNAQRMRQGMYATDHQLNKPLLDFIKYNLDPGESQEDYNKRYREALQKVGSNAPFMDKVQHLGHQFINAIPDPNEYRSPEIAPRQINPLQQDIEKWQRDQLQQQVNATPLPDNYRTGGRVRMI